MKIKYLIPLLFIALNVNAQDYPHPVLIGEIEQSASEFCWVGDQNEDGYDDLMTLNFNNNFINTRYELHYGAEDMSNSEPFLLREPIENERFGWSILYIGNLISNQSPIFAQYSHFRDNRNDRAIISTLNLYEMGIEIDEYPDIVFSRDLLVSSSLFVNGSHRSRPSDFNGDGFNDLLSSTKCDTFIKPTIFFGGMDFDTIPDWEFYIDGERNPFTARYSTGHDVNNDGFSDILLQKIEYDYFFQIYLGGSPMDTFPTCEVGQYDFEGRWGNRRLIPGFAMLPDINDDGYDDWGIYFQEYWEQYNNDGFYIFFGGEEPDMEPDLEIVGKQRLWDDRAEIAGGDFNGDGIGDIVTGFSTSPYGGEIHIHFGGRYINPEPDIYFHSGNWYDERFDRMGFSKLGAVGDYNGDGVDDFVVAATGGEYIARTLIVAGNPDWEVGVSNDRIPDSFSYSLTASPNPFNNSINISFDLPVNGQLELVVYDIKGRKIDILVDQRMVKGSHGISWQSNQSGVYLFVLWNGDRREVRKVVCMR